MSYCRQALSRMSKKCRNVVKCWLLCAKRVVLSSGLYGPEVSHCREVLACMAQSDILSSNVGLDGPEMSYGRQVLAWMGQWRRADIMVWLGWLGRSTGGRPAGWPTDRPADPPTRGPAIGLSLARTGAG